MISFPNCKINLGLNIIAKRSDGFHDLQTVFLPVAFEDCLEIERAANEASITITGVPVEGKIESNLCWRAYELLKAAYNLPPVDIKLHKQIPTGSGLGGGSSDAAFTLTVLNQKFNLGLNQETLIELASRLGSDCPFFIINRPCIGTGRGDLLEPIEIPQLESLFGVLVMPGIHISSAWAFQQIRPGKRGKEIREVITGGISDWREDLSNDFESPVFQTYPQLRDIKNTLYASGAKYASLSGSGSAIYGFFDRLPNLEFPSSYLVKSFAFNRKES